jgi:hypothetical protein
MLYANDNFNKCGVTGRKKEAQGRRMQSIDGGEGGGGINREALGSLHSKQWRPETLLEPGEKSGQNNWKLGWMEWAKDSKLSIFRIRSRFFFSLPCFLVAFLMFKHVCEAPFLFLYLAIVNPYWHLSWLSSKFLLVSPWLWIERSITFHVSYF